jgi:arylsulfatase A-like enzyme
LEPITEWIKAGQKPFLLTILCSVTHDPYEVPQWFAKPAKEPIERYRQAIFYTDKFLAALDVELASLNLTDKTILCVIGDHGEAFGEHGLLGHERIAFEEVLRIPWIIKAPFLLEADTKVIEPVSSVDLTPTLLSLLGFNTNSVNFDGINVLGSVPEKRKVYFSGWMQQGPAGFIKDGRKFIYDPANKSVSVYDLVSDPLELVRIEVPQQQANEITNEVITWRKNSIFRINQQRTGKKILFSLWLCNWNGRVSSVKYQNSN